MDTVARQDSHNSFEHASQSIHGDRNQIATVAYYTEPPVDTGVFPTREGQIYIQRAKQPIRPEYRDFSLNTLIKQVRELEEQVRQLQSQMGKDG